MLDPRAGADVPAGIVQGQDFDDWFANSPLVEIAFGDERLRAASPVQS